jgi:hypothetical protein
MLKEVYEKVDKSQGIKEQAKELGELLKTEDVGRYSKAPVEWLEHKIETGEINIL